MDDMPDGSVGEARTDPDELLAFWETARFRGKVVRTPEVTGLGVAGTLVPPAWSFGDTPELADALLALVLDGRKTATATAVVEFEAAGEPLPVVGDLSIVLDGLGRPRALLRTTAVRRVRFADVDAAHAAAEGEVDGSLESWRTDHDRYWRRVLPALGTQVGPDLELVLERFELRYPTARDG
ncbi:ASCH domain-containing protein [Isoptericola sp. b490]|uniref:ASCH domain-containing protein n=1 Tax=Actinotalea lenta TaxID=3064654 RepID=UPI0027135687|nr:ASCH domain-containing protein [Isoptericola sp. b490]MDO8120109.1 ASCH domain-containing protein [Isoptericola sp. b490]